MVKGRRISALTGANGTHILFLNSCRWMLSGMPETPVGTAWIQFCIASKLRLACQRVWFERYRHTAPTDSSPDFFREPVENGVEFRMGSTGNWSPVENIRKGKQNRCAEHAGHLWQRPFAGVGSAFCMKRGTAAKLTSRILPMPHAWAMPSIPAAVSPEVQAKPYSNRKEGFCAGQRSARARP